VDENHLKQRIVGAIVLVALAVIFIPMLLSGDRDGDMPILESNIPSKPRNVEQLKTLELSPDRPVPEMKTPDRTPVDEKTPQAETEQGAPEKTAPAESQDTGTSDASATPPSSESRDSKAWAVQVGSFSKQSNALGLRDKLRTKGYRAFVEKVSTDKGDVYRVRVGPEVHRSQAEELKKDLQAKLKLNGLVVAHP
jgi:DedD protein